MVYFQKVLGLLSSHLLPKVPCSSSEIQLDHVSLFPVHLVVTLLWVLICTCFFSPLITWNISVIFPYQMHIKGYSKTLHPFYLIPYLLSPVSFYSPFADVFTPLPSHIVNRTCNIFTLLCGSILFVSNILTINETMCFCIMEGIFQEWELFKMGLLSQNINLCVVY